jgi:hypothetical protein
LKNWEWAWRFVAIYNSAPKQLAVLAAIDNKIANLRVMEQAINQYRKPLGGYIVYTPVYPYGC